MTRRRARGVRLDSLAPGTRFALAFDPTRRGAVLRLGSAGALVKYDTTAPTILGDGTAIARSAEPCTISLATEVTVC